jgi:hypothetical protein
MRTQPTYPKRIGLLMDREDAEFYKRLKPSGPIASIRD